MHWQAGMPALRPAARRVTEPCCVRPLNRYAPPCMVYYTVYLKQLSNDTGYIDVGLIDDQLMKDYLTYLDIGMKSHRTYRLANPANPEGDGGLFAIDLTSIAAITLSPPVSHRPPARPGGARKG